MYRLVVMVIVASMSAMNCLPNEPKIRTFQALGCERDSDCPNGYRCEGIACINPELCGDGVIQPGEVCDDGPANSDRYEFARHCNSDCSGFYSGGYCGDGFLQEAFGEACDDGNDSTSDACPSGPLGPCQPAVCGDGFIWYNEGGAEECEPGTGTSLNCSEIEDSNSAQSAPCDERFCRYDTRECFDTPDGFVRIGKGTFLMGSPDDEIGHESDETLHEVTLTHSFYMMEHEVTQGEWGRFFATNPSRFSSCGDECPVETVNWWEALSYANALSEAEGLSPCYVLYGCNENTVGADAECTLVGLQDSDGLNVYSIYQCEGYRLPTEAEWEYAYRSGTQTAFYNGSITSAIGNDPNLNEIAWYVETSGGTTHPVKGKLPNAWGLYDMSGNVWEWVWDWYGPYVADGTNPEGSSMGETRSGRGGSWFNQPYWVRGAKRGEDPPGDRNSDLGFRLVRTAP